MTEKPGLNSSAGKFTERRAYPPDSPGKTTRQSRLISPTSFKQVLFKYCHRQTRTGRTFALASLEIRNLSRVAEKLGNDAGRRITRATVNTILKASRDADRICEVNPGQYLLILPDTKHGSEDAVLSRLESEIRTGKVSYNKQSIETDVSYRCVHSAAMGTDPEFLLNEIGYRVPKYSGALEKISQGDAASIKIVKPFSGSFATWLERYSTTGEKTELKTDRHIIIYSQTGRDSWLDNQKVVFKIIEPKETHYFEKQANLDALFHRARVLQGMEHPGINPCIDFHIKDPDALYLVEKAAAGETLSQLASTPDTAMLVDWSMQICNIIIYFQTLMPPVVPTELTKERLLISPDGTLFITDFEADYLFPEWYQPHAVTKEEMDAAQQGRPIRAFEPVIVSFARLMRSLIDDENQVSAVFDSLTDKVWPKHLNTVYKIRSELKRIQEEQLRTGMETSAGHA